MDAIRSEPERRARSLLGGAAACMVVGLLVAGTVSRTVGGVVTLVGWLASLWALHTLGRAGARG